MVEVGSGVFERNLLFGWEEMAEVDIAEPPARGSLPSEERDFWCWALFLR